MARPVFDIPKVAVRPGMRDAVRPNRGAVPVQAFLVTEGSAACDAPLNTRDLLDVFADAERSGKEAVRTYKLIAQLGSRAPVDMRESWMQSAALTLARMTDAVGMLRSEMEAQEEGEAEEDNDCAPRERMF